MDPFLIMQILQGVSAGVSWFTKQRGGDYDGALDVVEGYLKRPGSRLDPEVFDVVKMAAAGFQFLSARGVSTSEARDLLVKAHEEDRDLTVEEVDAFLAGTAAVAERVEDKLARLEAEEAAAAAAANPGPGGEGPADTPPPGNTDDTPAAGGEPPEPTTT